VNSTNIKDPGSDVPKKTYSDEQIRDYLADLEDLLEFIESAETHYSVLDVDELATTGEIKIAYTRATALLNPAQYHLDLPQPEEFLLRIDEAFEKVSQAFSVLVNFTRRVEYDDTLFQREEMVSEAQENNHLLPAANNIESRFDEAQEREKKTDNERRRYRRFELSLMVNVTGYDESGKLWAEMTQSVDVSVSGARLRLATPVYKGLVVRLSMPMPMTLRSYGFFDNSYDVFAIVRRIDPSDEANSLIGLEFLGDQPPPGYFDKPWDVFQIIPSKVEERRKSPRKKGIKPFQIEYYDSELNLLGREKAISEDFGLGGMRLCVKDMPSSFNLVRVTSVSGKFESLAIVTKRFSGKDGQERLCLSFIHKVERVN
jgi:hypothetical protein